MEERIDRSLFRKFIAEALADEYFYFAWSLRRESFIRFNYDPEKVFLRTKL